MKSLRAICNDIYDVKMAMWDEMDEIEARSSDPDGDPRYNLLMSLVDIIDEAGDLIAKADNMYEEGSEE